MLNEEQEIFEQINKAHNILVCFAKNWSGDSTASALAMYLFLKKQGKNAAIAADQSSGRASLDFLPQIGSIAGRLEGLKDFIISLNLKNTQVKEVKYKIEEDALNFIISPKNGAFTHGDISSRSGGLKYDLIIVVDSPDLESLGDIYESDPEFFFQIPIINIDRHPNNEQFGQINYIELTAIATSEILFNLISGHDREAVDEDIATCLLTGIITNTRSFKTQNITPQALSASSQLVALGARREEIVKALYRSRSINVLKLWGRVLARLNSALDDALVWSVLSELDFEKTGTGPEDLKEVVDELIVNIPKAKIIAICHEVKKQSGENYTRCIMQSTKNLNPLVLAKAFDPKGTKNYAEFILPKPIKEAEKEIINTVQSEIEKLPDLHS